MIKDVDGFKICKMIRDKGLNFPVIMLTAKIEDKDKIEGLTLGADDYIVKPFRTRELISRIKSVLRRYGKKEEKHEIKDESNHFFFHHHTGSDCDVRLDVLLFCRV